MVLKGGGECRTRRHYGPGRLVAENRIGGPGPVDLVELAVTDPTRQELHDHLVGVGVRQRQGFDPKRARAFGYHGNAGGSRHAGVMLGDALPFRSHPPRRSAALSPSRSSPWLPYREIAPPRKPRGKNEKCRCFQF